MAAMTSGKPGAMGGLPNSEMSAPAMKVRPSHMRTTAFRFGVAAIWAKASTMPARKAAESAFTGGLLKVMTAMSSSLVRAVMGVIFCP